MSVSIAPLANEEDARAKAYVHFRAWKEAYRGLVDQDFLDARTYELSEQAALRAWRAGIKTLLARDAGTVVGFADYGPYRGDDLPNAGEVYAIYLLESHYGQGIGSALMERALAAMPEFDQLAAWVLAGNERAIGFYRHLGLAFDGAQQTLMLGTGVTDLRMVLER